MNRLHSTEVLQRLEPDEGKLSRPVLRGGGDRKAASLPDEQDLRNSGEIKWKPAMHLLRLLLTGAATLRDARVPVRVETHRERLLAVKRGEMPWAEVDAWRKELHHDFERALAETKLPERPDYEAANRFLIKARREMANGKP